MFAASSVAIAQPYPAKPIRIVVPFPPGGSTDLLARRIGEKLQAAWTQPVIVENRPGAGGTVGSDAVAKSAPDGYTLLMGVTGTHAISASLFAKLPYDPVRDFTPITLVVSVPLVLVTGPSVPARSLAEVTALARARPASLTYGSPGNGTSMHLTGEMYNLQAGVATTHIPYRGSAGAMSDLLGGQIAMMWSDILVALPHVRAGKVRAIVTTGAKRHYALPDVPTVAEAGLAGFEVNSWQGLFGPAGMPPEIVARLNAAVVKTLALPDVREFLTAQGFEPSSETSGNSPEAFAAHVRSEVAKWARVVRASNAKPD
jgi:tripartite-type tricarboxylate transporter receptor subunit TctC